MHIINQAELANYGKILCEIGVEGEGDKRETVITGVVLAGKLDWYYIMRVFQTHLKCRASIRTHDISPVTVLSGGDHREKVKEILLRNHMYTEDQIHVWPDYD